MYPAIEKSKSSSVNKKRKGSLLDGEKAAAEKLGDKTDRISHFPTDHYTSSNPASNHKRLYWLNYQSASPKEVGGSLTQRGKPVNALKNFRETFYNTGAYFNPVSLFPQTPMLQVQKEYVNTEKSQITNESLLREQNNKTFEGSSLKLNLKDDWVPFKRQSELLKELEPLTEFRGFEERAKFASDFALFAEGLDKLIKENGPPTLDRKTQPKPREAGQKLCSLLMSLFKAICTDERTAAEQNSLTNRSAAALERSRLPNPKEKLRQRLEELRQENNILYTEVTKLKLLVGEFSDKERILEHSELQISQLVAENSALKQSYKQLKERKEENDFKRDGYLQSFADTIAVLRTERQKLLQKLEAFAQEIESLKVENQFMIKQQEKKYVVLAKEQDKSMMMAEDLSERMRQVFELRQFISEIKVNIGLLETNRDKYNMRVLLQDKNLSKNAEDIAKCLESFNAVFQKELFTYSISTGADKDPLLGNSFALFKALLQVQTSVSLGLDGRNSLRFTAFDGFKVEKEQIDRFAMEFLNYRIIAPNIFNLVQAEVRSYPYSVHELFSTRFRVMPVLQYVRVILDSYYTELLSLEETRHAKEFGHFVYMWFEYFDIDPATHKVCKTLRDPEQASTLRLEFLIQLSSPVFLKLWDSYFFIEALCNHFSRDELAYYLYLRFYVFQGTQQHSTGVAFDYRTKVSIKTLKKSLQELDDPESNGTNVIFQCISESRDASASGQEKSDDSPEALKIDLNLVLRVYLEVYICKKATRIKACFDGLEAYRSAFEKHSSTFSFNNFRRIVSSNFPSSNSSDIVQFYSRIANFTHGGAYSLKSFFIAGQEICFFSLPSFFKPLYKFDHVKAINLNPVSLDYRVERSLLLNTRLLRAKVPGLELIEDYYQMQQKSQELLLQFIAHTSHEEVVGQRSKLTGILEQLGSVTLTEAYQRSMYGIFYPTKPSQYHIGPMSNSVCKLKNLERRIIGAHIDTKSARFSSTAAEFQYFKSLLLDYDFGSKMLDEIESNITANQQMQTVGAKRLQRFFKMRLGSFYRMIVELIKLNRVAHNIDLRL